MYKWFRNCSNKGCSVFGENFKIYRCSVHHGKMIFKWIQGLGMSEDYNNDSLKQKIHRKFINLAFLR